MRNGNTIAAFAIALAATPVLSHEVEDDTLIEEVYVEGRSINLIGDAVSASEGIVGQQEISRRPIARTGEVLEHIPGMVVTQHSGSGKANQYFLRGFNLDHGTDFSTKVDGMPINMRSHGHGQGYTDLNFLIPETVNTLSYKKGAYYADIGDFSGAGGVEIDTSESVDRNRASLTLGEDGFQRALLLADTETGQGNTLIAIEDQRYDGPWSDIEEDIRKRNLLLKFVQDVGEGKISAAFMAYKNEWNSADQIPERAVEQGLIDRLGSIDTTVGGESSRYSFNVNWQMGSWSASAYYINYDLNLWSNFTYFLDDETDGDQFEQVDDRKIYGGELSYQMESSWQNRPVSNRFGLQFRADDIAEVGLYQTQARQRLGVTRSDAIDQHSVSAFWENQITWNHHIRTVFGVRHDSLRFDVDNLAGTNRFGVDLSSNSGDASDDLTSLKGSLIYKINRNWEVYTSAGQGFHSNDARGTTINVDPASGNPVQQVDPLVRSLGYELGMRGFIQDQLNVSLSIWRLELDSELLFVGDAGGTEASGESTREGIEFVSYYFFNEWLSADLEYAYSTAQFDDAGADDEVPGAVEGVLQAGINLDFAQDWSASLRFRGLGERPLTEDGSIVSSDTATWNLRLAYQQADWRAYVDVLNLTDREDNDIEYYYESRLAGEPSGSGTEDVHFHPIEPRTTRLTIEALF